MAVSPPRPADVTKPTSADQGVYSRPPASDRAGASFGVGGALGPPTLLLHTPDRTPGDGDPERMLSLGVAPYFMRRFRHA
jgi:hypothetical protein